MPLTATARSEDDSLRQDVLVGGRHRLVTDESWRLGGTDAGPAPHELVPAKVIAKVPGVVEVASELTWTQDDG